MRGIISLLILCLSWAVPAAQIRTVDVDRFQNKTRVTVVTDALTPYHLFILPNPWRLVMDLENTPKAPRLHPTLHQGLIQRVRAGFPKPGTLRLVFETAGAVAFVRTPWQNLSSGDRSFTLILSSSFLSPHAAKHATGIPASYQALHHASVLARHAPKTRLRDVVVVIDPGHGGHDPGAGGPWHAQEKEVTLAIARTLKQRIDREPGMRAVLTRGGDYYVGLRERLRLARIYHGDIFVSIHADAFINSESTGASVFALSQRGATSEAARWLAAKENYSELGGVNLKELDDGNGLVRSVLLDLSQTATIRSSLQMGTQMLQQLSQITRLHNHHVEQARFMVLKSPDIPSVLVETGFISNPGEARRLMDRRYQTRLAQAIFQGLQRYFFEYPPQGTRLEAGISRTRKPQLTRKKTGTSVA